VCSSEREESVVVEGSSDGGMGDMPPKVVRFEGTGMTAPLGEFEARAVVTACGRGIVGTDGVSGGTVRGSATCPGFGASSGIFCFVGFVFFCEGRGETAPPFFARVTTGGREQSLGRR